MTTPRAKVRPTNNYPPRVCRVVNDAVTVKPTAMRSSIIIYSVRNDVIIYRPCSCFLAVCTSRGYCSFPTYLWDQLQDGGQRTWMSRMEFIRDTDTWQKRKEITVNDTEIYVRMKLHASCSERRQATGAVTAVPCFRQDALYRIICISEEPDMKFRVQVISNE